MLRASITARSAKLIMALLLFGSISGFVLGQELHHSTAAHRIAVTTTSASSSLGSAASRVIAGASHTQTASVTRPSAPSGRHKGHHHEGDTTEGDGAMTLSADSSGSVHANYGDGESGGDGGDH